MTARALPEDELAYARARVMAWCSREYPGMTLGQVQSLALLLALERQKAAEAVERRYFVPWRERRICMPVRVGRAVPAASDDDVDEDAITQPRGASQ